MYEWALDSSSHSNWVSNPCMQVLAIKEPNYFVFDLGKITRAPSQNNFVDRRSSKLFFFIKDLLNRENTFSEKVIAEMR